jgi:hypothetical protein
MKLTAENAGQVVHWCNGKLVQEIDEKDSDILHPAVNVQTKDGVDRAHVGDDINFNHDSGFFEITKA